MPSASYLKVVQRQADKAPKILAKTLVKELVHQGYTESQIILIVAEVLHCLQETHGSQAKPAEAASALVSYAT